MAVQKSTEPRRSGGKLPVDVERAFLAVPQPQHVANLPGLSRVPERGAAMGDLPVVEVLELALLYAELHPLLGRVDDLAEGGERVGGLGVERLASELLPIDD